MQLLKQNGLIAGIFGGNGCALGDKIDIQCGSAGLSLGSDDISCGAAGLSTGAVEKNIKADPSGLFPPSEAEAKRLLVCIMGTIALQAAYRERVAQLFSQIATQHINQPNGPAIVASMWLSVIEKTVCSK